MLTIVRLSQKPCFLCGSQEDTVEVRFKDRTFAGVVCKNHLFELMKTHSGDSEAQESTKTPKRASSARTGTAVEPS